jgi:hypothetical protein
LAIAARLFAVIVPSAIVPPGIVPPAFAQTPAPAEIPIGLPDTRRLESFANGDIRHSPGADIYFFVVQASDRSGQFWLQCDRRGPFTVAIAMVGTGEQRQRSQRVTVQPDQGPPRRLDLVVFENFVAIASRLDGKPDENASVFMDALTAARKTFTISYGGSSHDFDVAPMQEPRTRFLALCRQQKP